MEQPVFYVFGGPNGVGKSTLSAAKSVAGEFLENVPIVDPDAIARRINPEDVSNPVVEMKAAKEALAEIKSRFLAKKSFIWETTLSSSTKFLLGKLQQATQSGFSTQLHFIGTPHWHYSRCRVNLRFGEGGHDIPTATLKRRYTRTMGNLPKIACAVDKAVLYRSDDCVGLVPVVTVEAGAISMTEPDREWIRGAASAIKHELN